MSRFIAIVPKFTNELYVTPISLNRWRLSQSFGYDSAVVGARILVPEGFETDFASVPRMPLAYWLFGNTAHKSAVIHDWLYQTQIFSREASDLVFLEAMAVEGIPNWRREPMYAAVVAFGNIVWQDHARSYERKEDIVVPLVENPNDMWGFQAP